MRFSECTIGDLFEVARGGSPRPIEKFLTDGADGINWIMIGDAEEGSKYIYSTKKKIRPEGLKKSRKVFPGDFLLTNSMSFGRPYITKTEGCIHDGWLVLSPKDPSRTHADYFYYLLGSPEFKRIFVKQAAGAVVKNLNSSLVRAVPLRVPTDVEEQRRVARILDQTESVREKCRQLLSMIDRLVEATFIDMFGRPDTNPKNWPVKPFHEIAQIDTNMVDPRKAQYQDMIHIGPDVIQGETGRILPARTVREDGLTSGKYLFNSDHLLYAKIRPYLRKVALPSFSGLCSADVYPIKALSGVSTREFLWGVLISPAYVRYFNRLPTRANIPKINMKEMNAYECFCPPHHLQLEFSKKVSSIMALRAELDALLTKGDELAMSISQRAFRGEL